MTKTSPSNHDLDRPLLRRVTALRRTVHWDSLGSFPTPIEAAPKLEQALGLGASTLFIKRDDLSSSIYGGNKVRTLEVLFGMARAKGASCIYATGAFGSNHALATVLHAPRVGLKPAVMLFPQPHSACAAENLRVILKARPSIDCLPHWSALPFAMAWRRRHASRPFLMVPGGAIPTGALGYVSAALELAEQVEAGVIPAPRTIVLGVGSTCTSAGLALGVCIASQLKLGWSTPPHIRAVRVTPWPVTSPIRILNLARQTSKLLYELSGDSRMRVSRRMLRHILHVDGAHLGGGYGVVTQDGGQATQLFTQYANVTLDTTYSGKSGAGLISIVQKDPARGPFLYWATKSSAPLPEVNEQDWRWAPTSMIRWLSVAHQQAT